MPFFHSDLEIFMVGVNFYANEDFVFKFNYQMQENLAAPPGTRPDTDLVEIGIGFAY